MAKIGCLKPFRGSWNGTFQNTILEDGEIAFDTTWRRIFIGDGTNTISQLLPAVLGLRSIDLAGKNIDTIPQDFPSDYIIAGSRWEEGDDTTGTVPTGYIANEVRFLTYIRSYGAAYGVMRIHVDFGATSKIYERIHWYNNTFSEWVEVSQNSNAQKIIIQESYTGTSTEELKFSINLEIGDLVYLFDGLNNSTPTSIVVKNHTYNYSQSFVEAKVNNNLIGGYFYNSSHIGQNDVYITSNKNATIGNGIKIVIIR